MVRVEMGIQNLGLQCSSLWVVLTTGVTTLTPFIQYYTNKRGYVPLIVLLCTLLALFVLLISSRPSMAVSDDTCLDPLGDIPLQNAVSVPAEEAAVTGIGEYDNPTQSLTITYHNLSQVDDF